MSDKPYVYHEYCNSAVIIKLLCVGMYRLKEYVSLIAKTSNTNYTLPFYIEPKSLRSLLSDLSATL